MKTYIRVRFHQRVLSGIPPGRAGATKQKRCFPKAILLENSQVNLQYGRCKLTKHRSVWGRK